MEAETVKAMNLTNILATVFLLSIAVVYLASLPQTDSHPRATIEGGYPPRFMVSGRGTLDSITVSGPDKKRKAPEGAADYREEYWMIMPKSEMDVQRLEESGGIIYGKVPEGFVQWIPKSGAPAALFEGGLFNFHLRTKGSGGAVSIFFTLREGKVITTGD